MSTTRRGPKAARHEAEFNMADRTSPTRPSARAARNPPYLPTPFESVCLALFPLILVFGTIYSLVSPHTRSAPYDYATQAHSQDPQVSPSYFARKSNLFNVLFVKRGWGWNTVAFVFFLVTHPSGGTGVLSPRRLRAGLRWALVTGWWILVTQWCFGAPIIDRGFRWTGGKCEVAEQWLAIGDTSVENVVTSVACKAAGGRWKGGHDISGHVFLLVLGTAFLAQEVGWAALRWSGWRIEQRCVVMSDGAVKSASVESDMAVGEGKGDPILGLGGKAVVAIILLNLWMLLMTAIYFHTWFEKFTGLTMAMIGVYAIYYVPRLVPALRGVVGLPGI